MDGTHENFDLLNAYPTRQWKQGTVHEIRPNILHLMRGEIFEIDGHSLFAFGGGETEEKEIYMETGRWWPEEMPTREEMIAGQKHLFDHQLTVDYIITLKPLPKPCRIRHKAGHPSFCLGKPFSKKFSCK